MNASPFLLNVGRLQRHRGTAVVEHVSGSIPGLRVAESSVPDDATVDVDVTLESADGGVVAVGKVRAPWQAECRRCLKPISGVLESEVRELFSRGDDTDTYKIDGDQIDLEPLARDALLLELPVAPLCRPDCKGLCPNCGINRNDESCDCEIDARDYRWAALDALMDDGTGSPDSA